VPLAPSVIKTSDLLTDAVTDVVKAPSDSSFHLALNSSVSINSAPRTIEKVEYFDIHDGDSDAETTCSDLEHGEERVSPGSPGSSEPPLHDDRAECFSADATSSENAVVQAAQCTTRAAVAAEPPLTSDHAPSQLLSPLASAEHPGLIPDLPCLKEMRDSIAALSDGAGVGKSAVFTSSTEAHDLAAEAARASLEKANVGEPALAHPSLESVWFGLSTLDLFMDTMGSVLQRTVRPSTL
jgi:hypothetical protein